MTHDSENGSGGWTVGTRSTDSPKVVDPYLFALGELAKALEDIKTSIEYLEERIANLERPQWDEDTPIEED